MIEPCRVFIWDDFFDRFDGDVLEGFLLPLNSPSINERVSDLAKVQSLIFNDSEWSLEMIVELLKESMVNVNSLSLNGNYSGRHYDVFSPISLPPIRTLKRRRNFSFMKSPAWRKVLVVRFNAPIIVSPFFVPRHDVCHRLLPKKEIVTLSHLSRKIATLFLINSIACVNTPSFSRSKSTKVRFFSCRTELRFERCGMGEDWQLDLINEHHLGSSQRKIGSVKGIHRWPRREEYPRSLVELDLLTKCSSV